MGYKELRERMTELAQPRVYQYSPAIAGEPRRAAARERNGRSRVKQLRHRHARGEFGTDELHRRIAQTWQSI